MTQTEEDEQTILAIDHGTSGVKAAIVSTTGRIVDFEFEATPVLFLPDGGVEQNPLDWWNALLTTSKRLVARGRVSSESITAVCCSSTFSTTVAVDAAGDPVANALTWMDARGAPHVKRVMRGVVNVEGYSPWKILQWVPRTGGGPTLSGKDDVAHVLYWKHEQPEVYKKTHMFLGSKDFLNLKLSGRYAASFDSIQLFWVTDTRNIRQIHYDGKLIKILGLDREKLPPLRHATEILGTIRPEVAREIGLRDDTRIVVGSPDLQSACVGSGAVRDYEGHIYIGTSSWLLCHVPFKKTDLLHTMASLPSSIPGKYFCANEQETAGGCLEFLLKNLIFHKNELRSESRPEDVFKRLDRIVERVPAGSCGVVFTPWLNGEKTPVDDESVRGGFHNLSLTTNLDHLIRSVFEGVAMNTRWILKYAERFIRRPMDTLNIIGGGAESDAWCQIHADVLNRTIRQVADPIQSNARGAAFIASVALGAIRFEDIPRLIPYAGVFQPNPKNRALYDGMFKEFVKLYKKNRAIHRRLAGLRGSLKSVASPHT